MNFFQIHDNYIEFFRLLTKYNWFVVIGTEVVITDNVLEWKTMLMS